MTTDKTRPAAANRALYERMGLVADQEEMHSLVALMKSPQRLELINSLDEHRYLDELNQLMFLAFQRQLSRAKDPDVVGLAAEARRIAKERRIDIKLTPQDFGNLIRPDLPDDMETVTRRLHDASLSREIVDFARWVLDQVQDYVEPSQLVNSAQERLSGIRKPKDDTRIRYGDQMPDLMLANIEQRRAAFKEGKSVYIDWPWPSWNRNIGIHTPGKIMMIAMPDGAGKSTVGAQIGWHTATKLKRHTFIIALEDAYDSIEGRIAARLAGLNYNKVMIGDISDAEYAHLAKEVRENFPPHLHFATMPGASMGEIIREMEIQRMNGKLDVCLIDYFNAAAPTPHNVKLYGGLYNSQKGDANDLVAFSGAERVPIIVFDQMTKGFMKLSDKEKREQGRANIFGGSGKFHASTIVMLGENTGLQGSHQTDGIAWWVDKANNNRKGFGFNQILTHGRYIIEDTPI